MRLDNNSIESIYKTQEKEITRTKDLVDFRFLDSSFEALIDDVIGMTHRKIISDLDIWNQYFIITLRERKLVMRVGFCSQFKNSMISDRKFSMPMLSLIFTNAKKKLKLKRKKAMISQIKTHFWYHHLNKILYKLPM